MLTAAALVGLVSWRLGIGWHLPAYAYLACVAVALSIIDLREHRLPNALVYPSVVVVLVLLVIASAITGAWPDLLRAVAGGAGVFLLYLVLAVISPHSVGMGDVKLAALIGMALAYRGGEALLIGTAAGFVIGGVIAVIALALRRVTLRGALPFGPAMFAGAFLGLLLF